MTSVREAVSLSVRAGDRLPTPTGRGTFEIAEVDADRMVLLLGAKRARTVVTWRVLEGAVEFLRGRGPVVIGSVYDGRASEGTLDAYLKQHIHRATAGWVAVVLERSGVIELSRERRPATVRLLPGW